MKSSNSGSECKIHDRQEISTEYLEKFTKMVQNASILANRLSSNELLSAFQISFHLMEKISDVMLSMCTSSKNEADEFTSSQMPWKYPPYTQCILNDDSQMGFCSMKTQSTSENDDCETDQHESQLKVVIEDENLCDSGVASNRDVNLTGSSQKLSPDNDNHSPHSYSNKCLSSPITNDESSVLDIDENYSITDKCEISRTSDMIDDNDIRHINAEINSKIHLRKQNSTNRKITNDKQFDDGQLSPDISDQSNSVVELYDSQTPITSTATKFQVDTKRWRLTSADKLNTLIDECERQINGRKLYVCKFCGKIYEIKSSMRYHMKIIHLQMHLRTTEMQCRICGKQFTCVSAVNRHQSKCVLSTITDSRIQNNTNASNHSFTTSPVTTTPSSTDGDIHSHMSLNPFTTQTSNNTDIHLNTSLTTDSNILTSPLNSSKKMTNIVNFQSAFRIPETCTTQLLNQTISKAYNTLQTTNLNLRSLIPTSNNINFSNKSHSFQSFNDTQSLVNLMNNNNNNPMDCFDSPTTSTHWSTSAWSTMPTLGCNFSELTPAQIDICMKAVVHGICSTVEQCTNNNSNHNNITTNQESIESTHITSDTCHHQTDETIQWNSSHKQITNFSETDRSLTSQTNEMAMDLSSRPRSATLMIESF
ncbi:hypothetical protein MN116_000839 [Schistosoma mekongi]|uniref:C2H2-type domain-containing protein n=1 Tax=Schistosoma mekongi TaxID=38744 RepID=A0AAE1ZKH5_SCHME|nr:hypothetical protein MN116_000839 [Schistosoma mekongi]